MFTPSQATLTGPQSYKEDGGEELLYTSAPQKELGEFADSLGQTPGERYAALVRILQARPEYVRTAKARL